MDMNTIRDTTLQFGEQNTKEKIFNVLNLSIPVLMGIFIFFVPFPHTTAIKETCFYGSIIIVLILTCFKKTDFSFKSPLTLPFALFTAWAFIGLFFALDKGNSIHDFRAHLLKYLAIYYILINFFNSRKRLIILSWIIIISAAIFSIGGLTYFYVILKNPISTRFGFSRMMAIDLIGFVTIFAMLLSMRQLRLETNWYLKAILVVCLLGTFAATYLTMSRGSLGAVFIALIVFFVKKNKLLVVFLIIFSLIAVKTVPALKARFSLHYNLKDIRIGINLTTLEIIKDYPITGIGFGMETYGYSNFFDLAKYNAKIPPQYQQKTLIRSPHNSLAGVAVRTGIVGLALFLFIYFIFVRLGWKIIRYGKDDFIKDWGICIMAAFIGVFIQGLFADGMFGPQVIVLYTIFAIMTILWKLNTETDNITT
ncbi:MAG: O-antigen ligase family protein [Candidatus Atribacteria bacterium]|nr:O-antigen ligase family protein [Candidatus Atribacteria bacterium]